MAGRTPEHTLAACYDFLRDRDAGSEHELYTPETRSMLRGWIMTPAQMDMVLRSYRRCAPEPARIDPGDRLAVMIRYPAKDRACAPWFLAKSGTGWQLDLAAMQRAIRFGRNNEWRLAPGEGFFALPVSFTGKIAGPHVGACSVRYEISCGLCRESRQDSAWRNREFSGAEQGN